MNVCAIMATCGRHKLAERSLRFFLDQDYSNKHYLLIYNNSDVSVRLQGCDFDQSQWTSYGKGKSFRLINKHTYGETGERYSNLGQIYNDALTYIPENTDVIIHWDDDDLFLPNHITEGVSGLRRGNSVGEFEVDHISKLAYKPAKSYYRHSGGIQLMSNTLEPSIFVAAHHIREHGYSNTTTDQHLQWVNPLVYSNHIFVDEKGPATLIYNWGDTDIPTFKTSGNAGNPENFNNYRNFSKDHGDRVLTPWSKEEVQKYYDLVYAK